MDLFQEEEMNCAPSAEFLMSYGQIPISEEAGRVSRLSSWTLLGAKSTKHSYAHVSGAGTLTQATALAAVRMEDQGSHLAVDGIACSLYDRKDGRQDLGTVPEALSDGNTYSLIKSFPAKTPTSCLGQLEERARAKFGHFMAAPESSIDKVMAEPDTTAVSLSKISKTISPLANSPKGSFQEFVPGSQRFGDHSLFRPPSEVACPVFKPAKILSRRSSVKDANAQNHSNRSALQPHQDVEKVETPTRRNHGRKDQRKAMQRVRAEVLRILDSDNGESPPSIDYKKTGSEENISSDKDTRGEKESDLIAGQERSSLLLSSTLSIQSEQKFVDAASVWGAGGNQPSSSFSSFAALHSLEGSRVNQLGATSAVPSASPWGPPLIFTPVQPDGPSASSSTRNQENNKIQTKNASEGPRGLDGLMEGLNRVVLDPGSRQTSKVLPKSSLAPSFCRPTAPTCPPPPLTADTSEKESASAAIPQEDIPALAAGALHDGAGGQDARPSGGQSQEEEEPASPHRRRRTRRGRRGQGRRKRAAEARLARRLGLPLDLEEGFSQGGQEDVFMYLPSHKQEDLPFLTHDLTAPLPATAMPATLLDSRRHYPNTPTVTYGPQQEEHIPGRPPPNPPLVSTSRPRLPPDSYAHAPLHQPQRPGSLASQSLRMGGAGSTLSSGRQYLDTDDAIVPATEGKSMAYLLRDGWYPPMASSRLPASSRTRASDSVNASLDLPVSAGYPPGRGLDVRRAYA